MSHSSYFTAKREQRIRNALWGLFIGDVLAIRPLVLATEKY